ncbi:MAG: MarR family winged helix-turn-helix transcriptional regulator [Halarcobacter sp.]
MKKESNFQVKKAEQSSGFLLWQVTTLWQREIKTALDGVNLNHSGFVILASLLWFKEQEIITTQTTIIEHTKLDKMTVSKSLKILEKNGFILRSENEIDTRAKTITLTHSGIELAIKSVKIVEDIDNLFFSKLNKKDKNQLNTLFLELLV